ncbi:MAG: fibronectin type III domain-containing protein, partial [Clostridia bacterium]|nr:fibronectin type III domain-containing protein [Clostridia bacterium]
TVTMKGNYTGTKTLTFKINPPKTTVASLTAGTKSITVAVTKKTTQTTGYQIQYSTAKDFTNAKTKTITSNTTTKATLSSLTSAKTYYVRVRTYKTVNDVKYYSGWSEYKYVKTK